MQKPVIKVENLSKRFMIGHEQAEPYTTLGDTFMRRAKRIFSPKRNGTRSSTIKEEFWALKDINFEIAQGDRVGIIGRNGAGKSTLLKILSRITEPTTGRITICSRVASLLEVGTGFHPELSGRENIFLNGAILGMSRSEIRKKFDEIVEFAEIERFLDTPVKKYSSGMYVRLAFAVAAHLEPEILVVDEVLAVGDAQFQKKCLGKMQDVSRNEGRTVLFVSHNMQAISNLCNKGIYLANGALVLHDQVDKAVETYLTHGERFASHAEILAKIGAIRPDPDYKLEDIRLFQDGKEVDNNIVNGKDLEVSIDYELYNKITGFRVFIDLCDDMGTVIFRSFHDELKEGITTMGPGRYSSKFTMPRDILAPLTYDLRIWFGIHTVRMLPPGDGINIRINVEQTGNYNRAYNGQYTAGRICIPFPWEINKL